MPQIEVELHHPETDLLELLVNSSLDVVAEESFQVFGSCLSSDALLHARPQTGFARPARLHPSHLGRPSHGFFDDADLAAVGPVLLHLAGGFRQSNQFSLDPYQLSLSSVVDCHAALHGLHTHTLADLEIVLFA